MKLLSQRDPSWSSDKLGESSLTLGRFGCTTTCISMLSDYFKCFKSPLELAHNAALYTKPGNPQGEGLIIWQALSLEKMKFVGRDRQEVAPTILKYMRDPDKAVILQVNNGAHWVVALRKTLLGNDYVIADPWDGKKKTLKATYRNVTGAAYFSLK